MKWKPNFKAVTLDLTAYKAELSRQMEDWVKQAAQAWLQATVISIIPTWSKASRATFQALAKDVGTTVPYGPLRSIKDREALGLSTGEGGLISQPSKYRWHFYYHTSLRYLAYNEYNKAVWGPEPPAPFRRAGLRSKTPYQFQEAGAKEFDEFTRFTRLPNPFDFLKLNKVN
jgi:hypothetical protein